MSESDWRFATKNFTIVCSEYEPKFIEPLVHSQDIINADDLGNVLILNFRARVYWRSIEIADALLSDCIHVAPDCDDNPHGHDRVFVTDHSYRRQAVRMAIRNARKHVAESLGGLPDLYVRETA